MIWLDQMKMHIESVFSAVSRIAQNGSTDMRKMHMVKDKDVFAALKKRRQRVYCYRSRGGR